jgi:hypothetical protein
MTEIRQEIDKIYLKIRCIDAVMSASNKISTALDELKEALPLGLDGGLESDCEDCGMFFEIANEHFGYFNRACDKLNLKHSRYELFDKVKELQDKCTHEFEYSGGSVCGEVEKCRFCDTTRYV